MLPWSPSSTKGFLFIQRDPNFAFSRFPYFSCGFNYPLSSIIRAISKKKQHFPMLQQLCWCCNNNLSMLRHLISMFQQYFLMFSMFWCCKNIFLCGNNFFRCCSNFFLCGNNFLSVLQQLFPMLQQHFSVLQQLFTQVAATFFSNCNNFLDLQHVATTFCGCNMLHKHFLTLQQHFIHAAATINTFWSNVNKC